VTFAICFDFPDEDDPVFAGFTESGAMGFASSLKASRRFSSEAIAGQVLRNSYGPAVAKFGVVVEVEEVIVNA
jgi:hypothetical protein